MTTIPNFAKIVFLLFLLFPFASCASSSSTPSAEATSGAAAGLAAVLALSLSHVNAILGRPRRGGKKTVLEVFFQKVDESRSILNQSDWQAMKRYDVKFEEKPAKGTSFMPSIRAENKRFEFNTQDATENNLILRLKKLFDARYKKRRGGKVDSQPIVSDEERRRIASETEKCRPMTKKHIEHVRHFRDGTTVTPMEIVRSRASSLGIEEPDFSNDSTIDAISNATVDETKVKMGKGTTSYKVGLNNGSKSVTFCTTERAEVVCPNHIPNHHPKPSYLSGTSIGNHVEKTQCLGVRLFRRAQARSRIQ